MPENIKLFLLDSETDKKKPKKEDDILSKKSSILKQFFIDNPMTFINLLKSAKSVHDLDDIKGEIIDEFYGGHSDEKVVIELIQEFDQIEDEPKKHNIQRHCTDQHCIFGFILNDDGKHVGIINAQGTIKMFIKNENENENEEEYRPKKGHKGKGKMSHELQALYEPFYSKTTKRRRDNHHPDPASDDEEEDEKSSNIFKKSSEMFKLSLKKLKSEFKKPDIKRVKLNFDNVLGQIIDRTKKYTCGIIIKSKDYGHRLIIVQNTPIIKGIPVFAVLDTDI